VENVEKMKNLSICRHGDIELCARSTYCYRQHWISMQHPTITQILASYPKFCVLPQLVCDAELFVTVNSTLLPLVVPSLQLCVCVFSQVD